LKWRSIMLLETYRNQNGPTNSAKEPVFKSRSQEPEARN
jgi:hypothetical protein